MAVPCSSTDHKVKIMIIISTTPKGSCTRRVCQWGIGRPKERATDQNLESERKFTRDVLFACGSSPCRSRYCSAKNEDAVARAEIMLRQQSSDGSVATRFSVSGDRAVRPCLDMREPADSNSSRI